jgi:hypothetical protein
LIDDEELDFVTVGATGIEGDTGVGVEPSPQMGVQQVVVPASEEEDPGAAVVVVAGRVVHAGRAETTP